MIQGAYGSMAITPEALKDALKLLVDRGYAGCNLTLPLKEAALPLMDAHDAGTLTREDWERAVNAAKAAELGAGA